MPSCRSGEAFHYEYPEPTKRHGEKLEGKWGEGDFSGKVLEDWSSDHRYFRRRPEGIDHSLGWCTPEMGCRGALECQRSVVELES